MLVSHFVWQSILRMNCEDVSIWTCCKHLILNLERRRPREEGVHKCLEISAEPRVCSFPRSERSVSGRVLFSKPPPPELGTAALSSPGQRRSRYVVWAWRGSVVRLQAVQWSTVDSVTRESMTPEPSSSSQAAECVLLLRYEVPSILD